MKICINGVNNGDINVKLSMASEGEENGIKAAILMYEKRSNGVMTISMAA